MLYPMFTNEQQAFLKRNYDKKTKIFIRILESVKQEIERFTVYETINGSLNEDLQGFIKDGDKIKDNFKDNVNTQEIVIKTNLLSQIESLLTKTCELTEEKFIKELTQISLNPTLKTFIKPLLYKYDLRLPIKSVSIDPEFIVQKSKIILSADNFVQIKFQVANIVLRQLKELGFGKVKKSVMDVFVETLIFKIKKIINQVENEFFKHTR